ncbi:MAG TPA: DUF2975 domain-containing protein [Sphingomicrobium sp.]|nr:DUF2975 domain-containing protein [Sphingomicrobium sp.]
MISALPLRPDTAGDPLLTAARLFLAVVIGLLLFAATFVTIGIGAILTVQRGEIFEKIAAAGAPTSAYPIVIVGFILVLAILLLTARFLLELRRMVDSVRQGDPFRPENADRLRLMGWIAVATQLVWLVVVAIARWVDQFIEEGNGLPDTHLGSGLLLILVLFILARVFRVGSDMRDELEGTV